MSAEEVIDLGDRLVIRYAFTGRGKTSGVKTSKTTGYVIHLSPRGRVARQETYWEWDKALEAWGWGSSDVVAGPRRPVRASPRPHRQAGGYGRSCRRETGNSSHRAGRRTRSRSACQ